MTDTQQVARITGGSVWNEDGFTRADVLIDGARITDAPSAAGLTIDATGCHVIPGLVDIHFHGCVGADFCDATPESLLKIARFEASRGITAICPATMTYDHATLDAIMVNAAAFQGDGETADLVGINMEGPYISPRKVGAQNPAFVRPATVDEFEELQRHAGGLIKLVDIAPEEPGNMDFIDACAGKVRLSLAHTCADYQTADNAFRRGMTHVTHLYNAMPPLTHRAPGPIAAAIEHQGVTPEIICDGVHIHPAMVRHAWRNFGAARMIMVSDTMRACGMPDGTYDLGGQDVDVKGPRATLADGTLAGSVTCLSDCLAIAVDQMGITLADAVAACTINPARAIGIDADYGTLEAGKVASVVILDGDHHVKHVILRGRLLR